MFLVDNICHLSTCVLSRMITTGLKIRILQVWTTNMLAMPMAVVVVMEVKADISGDLHTVSPFSQCPDPPHQPMSQRLYPSTAWVSTVQLRCSG